MQDIEEDSDRALKGIESIPPLVVERKSRSLENGLRTVDMLCFDSFFLCTVSFSTFSHEQYAQEACAFIVSALALKRCVEINK